MKIVVFATGMADALGEPFEQSPSNIQRDAPVPALATWDGEYAPGRFGTGVWTDDTGLSAALARTLINNKGYAAPAAARAYLDWYRGVGARGVGGTVRAAMQALDRGATFETSGVRDFPDGYVGNGTAMRVAPLGLYVAAHGGTLDELVPLAVRDARITHHHPEAEAGSLAVAAGVYGLLREQTDLFGLPFYLRELLDAKGYRWTRVRSLLVAVAAMQAHKQATPELFVGRVGREGDVAATVATALYCAVAPRPEGTSVVRAAIVDAVKARGDADTRASITAAFVGAAGSLADFPRSWVLGCHDADTLFALDQELQGLPVRPLADVLATLPPTS